MAPTKRGRGRPKVLSTVSVRVAIERGDLQAAEGLVPAFDQASALGVKHSRMDVLRAAIARGLRDLRSELDEGANG